MTQAQQLPAPSPIPLLANLRDLGGWRAADGRTVRTGVLFRSTDFRSVADDAAAALAPLQLRTIYDLRSAVERTEAPDPALAGVADVPLDVLADHEQAVPANLGQFFTDPAVAANLTAAMAEKAFDMMASTYRGFVTMESARTSYRRFYVGLLGEDAGPALFHCTAGKDRTGWAAASLLSVLGVHRDDVYDDYLATNDRLLPSMAPLFEKFAEIGGDPDSLKPFLGVQAGYLDTAFDEVERAFGGVEGYFADGLGIDDAAQARLREQYLTD